MHALHYTLQVAADALAAYTPGQLSFELWVPVNSVERPEHDHKTAAIKRQLDWAHALLSAARAYRRRR